MTYDLYVLVVDSDLCVMDYDLCVWDRLKCGSECAKDSRCNIVIDCHLLPHTPSLFLPSSSSSPPTDKCPAGTIPQHQLCPSP